MDSDKSELEGESSGKNNNQMMIGQKRKSVKRAQRYRKEWQRNPLFKDWLRPHPDNTYKAYCRICDKYLVSEVTVIKYHSQGKRHLSKALALHNSGGGDPGFRRVMKAEDDGARQLCESEDPENIMCLDAVNASTDTSWPTDLHNYIKPVSKDSRMEPGRRMDDSMQFMSKPSQKCVFRDDHSVYGENVANRIRKLNDEYLISIARHKIDQALFSVEMLKYKDQSVSVVSSDQTGADGDHLVSSGGVVPSNVEVRSDATVIYTISPNNSC